MDNKKRVLLFVFVLIIASVWVMMTKPTKLGLDLVGGSRLMLEAQTSDAVPKITPEIMESLQYAIGNRVNAMGVGETIVQRVGNKRLLVEIPNISDTAKAKELSDSSNVAKESISESSIEKIENILKLL